MTKLSEQQVKQDVHVEHTRHPPRLATIKQIASDPHYQKFLSEPALRNQIFKSASRYSADGMEIKGNGLSESGALIRIGRRLLINLDAYDDWLLSHRVSAASSGAGWQPMLEKSKAKGPAKSIAPLS